MPASAGPDAPLIALEQKLIDVSALEPAFFSAFGKAEEAMFEWDKRNPKPKMRKCQIGPMREFGEYIRQLMEFDGDRSKIMVADPSADLKAATLEHTQACAEWHARRQGAEERSGYPEAEASAEAMADQMYGLYCEISEMAATTLRGLAIKARFAGNSDRVRDSAISWRCRTRHADRGHLEPWRFANEPSCPIAYHKTRRQGIRRNETLVSLDHRTRHLPREGARVRCSLDGDCESAQGEQVLAILDTEWDRCNGLVAAAFDELRARHPLNWDEANARAQCLLQYAGDWFDWEEAARIVSSAAKFPSPWRKAPGH